MKDFKVGDILYVIDWDHDVDAYESGYIMIIDISETSVLSGGSDLYGIESLSGNIRWTAVSKNLLHTLPKVKYIGNVNESKALRILYGRR